MLFLPVDFAPVYAVLLLNLAFHVLALNVDDSCTHMAWGLGDVTEEINTAFADANAIAQNAVNMLLTLLNSNADPYGNRNREMSPSDRSRIEELMVAFLVPPKHPGYQTVTQALGNALWNMGAATIDDFQTKIICDTPEGPTRFVREISNPDGTRLKDPVTKEPSWQYTYMGTTPPIVLPIGQGLCQDSYTYQAFSDPKRNGARVVFLCPLAFLSGFSGPPRPAKDFPRSAAERGQDFSNLESPNNTIDYYSKTLAGTILHELHHLTNMNSGDMKFAQLIGRPYNAGGRNIDVAYMYSGITALTEVVAWNGIVLDLIQNADTVAFWATAVWLYGADWAAWEAVKPGELDLRPFKVQPPP